jgi:hypothetical protein
MTTRYPRITPAKLAYFRQILRYEPETGLFYWLEDRASYGGGVLAGDVAGTKGGGRKQIGVDGRTYRAHVMAYWFMTEQNVPIGFEIDHKDRDDSNNRWSNLRLATRSLNNHNSNPSSANTSGVRGVSWVKGSDCWDARITVDDIVYVIGSFDKFTDAVKARIAAEEHFFGEVFSKHALSMTEPLYQPPPTPKGPDLRTQVDSRKKLATHKRSTNTSGIVGVHQHPKTGRWIAMAGSRWVGSYETPEQAVEAREQRLKELYEGENVPTASELYNRPQVDGRTTQAAALKQATRMRKGNNSGVSGVLRMSSGRFKATFKTRYLGTFDTVEEAQAAREYAMQEHYAQS